MPDVEQTDLTALTVQLLSAYVSNNTVPSEQLAGLIETTRSALGGKVEPATPPEPPFPPAVSVRKSLASKDHILSLIDGKPYKTLKRHLSFNGLTPKDYRARYGLPSDYPMVAPNYSEARRAVAEKLGLGRRRANATDAPAVEEALAPAEELPETPIKAARATKSKAARKTPVKAAKAPAPTPAETAGSPVEAPPAIEVAAPKPRARKPKGETAPAETATATPKRGRKAADAAAPTADAAPKRARKPKGAAKAG